MIGAMITRLAVPNIVFVWNSLQPLLLLTKSKWFIYMLLEGKRGNYIYICKKRVDFKYLIVLEMQIVC